MKLLTVIVIALCAVFFINLLTAQLTVWGLSLYHVNSGIWGPYLLTAVAEAVVSTGIYFGKD